MMSSPAQTRLHRDYFRMSAPASAVMRAITPLPAQRAIRSLVLTLHPDAETPSETVVDGRAVPVVPFAAAARGVVALAVDDVAYAAEDPVDLLLPRSAFNGVADYCGANRIASLSLRHGAGRDDIVLIHLGACLRQLLGCDAPTNLAQVKQISLALNLHIAQRYGGLQTSRPRRRGGLAPWQLRLARRILEGNLEGAVSLEALAADCGLSVSHFSRGFSRSTGVGPHRWLVQRRIEVAKEMILEDTAPLAQIALACGFSDQSHFTRTFAALIGLTPGRWRAAQEHAPHVHGAGERMCA